MPDDENAQKARRGPYKKPNWRPFFLAELKRTNCVEMALDKAQINRSTLRRYRIAHPDFTMEMRDATEAAVDRVEGKTHLRCEHGDKVKKFDREGKEYLETVFPDTLIIRYLMANRPEKWHRSQSDPRSSQATASIPRVIMLPELEKAEQ